MYTIVAIMAAQSDVISHIHINVQSYFLLFKYYY